MKFTAVYTTSNGRPLDQYGSSRRYHTVKHTCCAMGGDINGIEEYVNNILTIKIATYPGLNLNNLKTKVCLAGPNRGLTVKEFIQKCCTDNDFSGTLASMMLCNDSELIAKNWSAEVKVKEYLENLGNFYESITGFEKVNFIVMTTALHRQADFNSPSYLAKKRQFNRCPAQSHQKGEFTIRVKDRYLPFSVIDMDEFLPVENMSYNDVYCRGRWEHQGNKIHIRGPYLEGYMKSLKRLHSKMCEKNRRKASANKTKNPFYLMCRIDMT